VRHNARRTLVVLALLAVAGPGLASGCHRGGGDNPDSAPPTATTPAPTDTSASPTATPSPTASTEVIEFSVDGAGPYLLGATLDALKATPGLDEIAASTTCPQNKTARGTGVWHDVRLSFHQDGSLYLLTNTSTSIPTPSGAWVGTPLAQLKTIYAKVTGQQLNRGTASAYLVTTLSGRGILFGLDATKTVSSMAAGESAYLRSQFTSGGAFC